MRYLLAILILIGLMIQPALAADGWLSEYKFKQQLKKMKRSKMRPTSVSCRKTGKGGLKAEIKAIWKPDDGKKTWQLYAFHGDLDWRPGPPEQWNKWKRVSYTTLRGRGGAKYRCALYEKK